MVKRNPFAMERRTVEQLGIDDAVKRSRRTRNNGAALGERVGNHEVGAQRNKRWRDAQLSNLAATMLRNAAVGREPSERLNKVNHSRVESIHPLFLFDCCCPRSGLSG